MVEACIKTIHLVTKYLTLKKQKGLVLNIPFCRETMISSAPPATSQITTQRLIISYECLANSSGLLLSYYNLNQPISIHLCAAAQLMTFTSPPACLALLFIWLVTLPSSFPELSLSRSSCYTSSLDIGHLSFY